MKELIKPATALFECNHCWPAELAGGKNKLSDNSRHIDESWAIAGGRYASAGPFNQRVVLPLPRAMTAIELYAVREEQA